MGGTHYTHWREDKCMKALVKKNARKRTLGRRSADGKVLLK
jgi:hypothetical protein